MKTKYKTSVYEEDNCIVRIHKPILPAEEKRVQEENIRRTLVRYYKETRK